MAGKKIKYMGSADKRTISKGDRFGGRLKDGISKDLVWSRENHFVVDSEEADLSEDAVAELLRLDSFKDVTEMSRIPSNNNEILFLGYPKSVQEDEVDVKAAQAEAKTSSGQAGGTGGSGGGTRGGGTTTGGSTGGRGAGGGST